MLRLLNEKESINVVSDQSGSPTCGRDLATGIMMIIDEISSVFRPADGSNLPLIFNYSNAGVTTWFEFALAIKELSGSTCKVNPISTSAYPTAAKRPLYSVLDTNKIQDLFHFRIPDWKDSLRECLQLMK